MAVLPCCLLVASAAAQLTPPPFVDPFQARSASGEWRTEVDPSHPYGYGPALYRISGSGEGDRTEITHPFTLHRAIVTGEGVTVGYGTDGDPSIEGAHLVVAAIGADGRARWRTEWPLVRSMDGAPSAVTPRLVGLAALPDQDRFVLLADELPELGRSGPLIRRLLVHRLSDGDPIGGPAIGNRPRGDLESFAAIGTSGLLLTVTRVERWVSRKWVIGHEFVLLDLSGSVVWTREWVEERATPSRTTATPAPSPGRARIPALIAIDERGFDAWCSLDRMHVRFDVARSDDGEWAVTESIVGLPAETLAEPTGPTSMTRPFPVTLELVGRHELEFADGSLDGRTPDEWAPLPDGRRVGLHWRDAADGETGWWDLVTYRRDGTVERSVEVTGFPDGDVHERWHYDVDLGFCVVFPKSRFHRLDLTTGAMFHSGLGRRVARDVLRALGRDDATRTTDGRIVTVETDGDISLYGIDADVAETMALSELTGAPTNYVSDVERTPNGDLLVRDFGGDPSLVVLRPRATGVEGPPFRLVRAFTPRRSDGLPSENLASVTRIDAAGTAWSVSLGQFLELDDAGNVMRRVGPEPVLARLHAAGISAILPDRIAIQDGQTGCLHLWNHSGVHEAMLEGTPRDAELADGTRRIGEAPDGGLWVDDFDGRVATWTPDGERGPTLDHGTDVSRPGAHGTWRWGFDGPPALWKDDRPSITLRRTGDRRWIRRVLDVTEDADGSVFVLQDRAYDGRSAPQQCELVEFTRRAGAYLAVGATTLPAAGRVSAEGDWILVGSLLLRRSKGEWLSVAGARARRSMHSALAAGGSELVLYDPYRFVVERWRLPR